jgi:hypothetical protein
MADKLISEGKCLYCGNMVTQRSMGTHLKKHLLQLEKENPAAEGTVFQVYIRAAEMFLHVLVKGEASFKHLDAFLRKIWMECCGHLSQFYLHNSKVGLIRKFEQVLVPGMKLEYEYDFGSTTSVSLQVVGNYRINQKENVLLLSRNEPLEILCSSCHKNVATAICSVHIYEGEGFYCEACAARHEEECEDFADYASMPVVNSPRMGTCGYTGGTIDTERDGVYVAR